MERVRAAARVCLALTALAAGTAIAVLAFEAPALGRTGPALVWATSLLVTGYVLGRLGDGSKKLEREASVVVRILGKARAEYGLRRALQALFGELIELFEASGALLAVRETRTGRVFLWEGRPGPDHGQSLLHLSEIDTARQRAYLFECGGCAAIAVRHRATGFAAEVTILDGEGKLVAQSSPSLPPELAAAHPYQTLAGISLLLGSEWTGRFFLLDPHRGRRPPDLRALQRLVRETTPAIENVYLARSLRARASAVERARVARELHDGVIQALIGLEMQVDVLRRQALEKSSSTAGALTHIQAHLHHEILTVRELMEQMKPMEVAPTELIEHLAEMVDKFRRETGIEASFVWDRHELGLAPDVCREVARIVQEALINVRRHSGAANVVVRLSRDGDQCLLVVDDNGRGFGFSGRLSQAELDAARKGPVVIKERVRSVGGELAVESNPDRGSRLEIRLPWRGHV